MHRNEFNAATQEQIQIPIVAWTDGTRLLWLDAGVSAPVGYSQITDAQAQAMLAPKHADLAAATLARARAMRLDILTVLDGLQVSALVTGATVQVLVGGLPTATPLAGVIEQLKQQLRNITTVDLSAATTAADMEALVLAAYWAIAAAAPVEVQSAFQSLVP